MRTLGAVLTSCEQKWLELSVYDRGYPSGTNDWTDDER